MKHHKVTFDTWGDFLSACETLQPVTETNSSVTGSQRFTGTKDYPEALELAFKGWHEGTQQADKFCEALRDSVSSLLETIEVNYSVVGHGLDIGKYAAGHPETWQVYDTVTVEGQGTRHVRVVFNASVSSGIDKDTIIQRGAAAAALVYLLEMAGNQVELWVGDCGATSRQKWELGLQLKQAGQPVDLPRVIFALAHPSFLRRLTFRMMETNREWITDCGASYGHPDDLSIEGDVVIGKAHLQEPYWGSFEATREWIIETLKTQGVTLKEQQ